METDFPNPNERRRGPVQGVPLKMGDGREWLLAHGGLAPALTELRDRLYEFTVTKGAVRVGDAYQAAWSLLTANYELSADEAGELLSGAEQDDLVEATMTALFGPENPRSRGWTEWALTGLQAADLDPTKIPAASLPSVLIHLERAGRIAPQDEFIGPAVWAAKRRKLGSMTAGG